MRENFYCVSSLAAPDEYFACYEQAVNYAIELAMRTKCGNGVYLGDMTIGLVEWTGYMPLSGGGFVDRYEYHDVHLTEQESCAMFYPDLFDME